MQDEIKPYIYYIPSMTDQALILAYQSGDNSALAELYRRYKDQLFWFIYEFVHDEEKARDLLQDTFLHLMRSGTYRPISKVSTWLYTIARNRVYEKHRNDSAQKRDGIEVSIDKEREIPMQIPSTERTPAQVTQANMAIEEVKKKLKDIKPVFAEAIRLRCFKGYTYEEIGQIMGVREGTVKSRIYRGRKLLQ